MRFKVVQTCPSHLLRASHSTTIIINFFNCEIEIITLMDLVRMKLDKFDKTFSTMLGTNKIVWK